MNEETTDPFEENKISKSKLKQDQQEENPLSKEEAKEETKEEAKEETKEETKEGINDSVLYFENNLIFIIFTLYRKNQKPLRIY